MHILEIQSGVGSQFTSNIPTTFNNTVDFGFDQNTIFDVEYPTVNIGTEQATNTFVEFSTNTSAEDSDTKMVINGTTNIQGRTYFRPLSEVFININDSEPTVFNGDVTFGSAITVDSDTTAGNTFDSELNVGTFNIVNLRGGDSEGANGFFGDSDSDRIGQFGHRFRIATKEIIYDSEKHLKVHSVQGYSLVNDSDTKILFFSQRN